jgi:putative tryptophan/tyrosine transport system substrate-binding protein
LEEGVRRRDFIKVIADSATAWPLTAHAQQRAAVPTIGYLTSDLKAQTLLLDTFRRGLKEAGFVEGPEVGVCHTSRY